MSYLLVGHYYERTNHPRRRHYPAVFALHQGEVAHIEVGADFIAFDTQLVRYPERGEPHYPGPWPDHFRVTVPFAQLYQVCRQVLPAGTSAAATVAYGPETIVYHDSAAQQRYPTPADINQAYATTPAGEEHPLVAVLVAIAAGLPDPANHYLINTTSFDSPAGPMLLGMLHLHIDAVGALDIADDAFSCEVLLDPRDRQQKSTVRVPFANVWQVLHGNTPNLDFGKVLEAGGLLYDAPGVLRTFTQQA